MNCDDCRAAGIEAVATRTVGKKHYCSSHARKYFPMGASLPPENLQIQGPQTTQAEGKRMGRLDSQAILDDHKAGMSDAEIAKKYGCHFTTVSMHLRKMGIFRMGQGGRKSRTAGAALEPRAIVHAAERIVAPAAPEKPASETAVPQLAANGHARCRVAMFEVEGDATSVQHAVDAIKAALEAKL